MSKYFEKLKQGLEEAIQIAKGDRKMKEMIYKNKLEKEILDEGTVDGYRYKIISYGSHPCAYVETHTDVFNYDDIKCHGGITFFENNFDKDHIFKDRKHIVIGWDYSLRQLGLLQKKMDNRRDL